jgi:hypothetical protein
MGEEENLAISWLRCYWPSHKDDMPSQVAFLETTRLVSLLVLLYPFGRILRKALSIVRVLREKKRDGLLYFGGSTFVAIIETFAQRRK